MTIKLSKRQRQLLALVDTGRRNQDIAAELGISEHTVKVHLWRLFQRLGVQNRVQAGAWWRKSQEAELPRPPGPQLHVNELLDAVSLALEAWRTPDFTGLTAAMTRLATARAAALAANQFQKETS